jgi:hypothetical protein
MILTQCAVCATDLGLTLGKKCGRCSTRYCGAECQKKHWEEGGHDQLCRKIKKAGGAEQYYANTKYAEAVAIAAEACAEDTKGQTCYICTQALHWKTKEGLVRGCSCRGTAGFAHVSCLAEQAKILLAEAVENNLGPKVCYERFERWSTCSLCEQKYHGVVKCGLGWACWKTYVGRPEADPARLNALRELGNGLYDAHHYEDALTVQEAELSMTWRLGAPEDEILIVQSNRANAYRSLGQIEKALSMRQEIYARRLKLSGEEHVETIREAICYALNLIGSSRFEEAKSLLLKTMPVARRVLGDTHEYTLKVRCTYAGALYKDDGATLDELREALTTLEELALTARRVMGGEHPLTRVIDRALGASREALSARDDGGVSAIRDAVAATTLGDA